MGIPVYYCLGNHDLLKGEYGEKMFEDLFGPVYYSFESGNIHFVVTPMLRGDHKPGFTKEDVGQDMKIYKAVGCDRCANGYKGRVGIYQVMGISEQMGRLIMGGANSLDLADQAAKEGIDDLRKSALKKVKAGLLSLEEANRITKD